MSGLVGTFRFLRCFAKPPGDAIVIKFLKTRIDGSLGILDKHLAGSPYILGDRPTIADLSLVGYLYYPAEELDFNVGQEHKNIGAWLGRIKALPKWQHPYDLMPGHPLPS
jgi:glutathione S-transferase